jgi:L-lactate dehydrogenase (cytochrome)/(S)-mandelate dehydrogenase
MRFTEALSIADLRMLAKRRLPRVVFEVIESGTEDEFALTRNEAAFRDYQLWPRYLVDVSRIERGKSLFGRRYSAPFGMAPTGFAGLFRKEADSMMACAAVAADVPLILSGASIEPLERVAAAAPDHVWCHLYPARDRAITADLIKRAADCGREVLVLTVDNPVYPNRERDTRNRFGKPVWQQTWSTLFEAATHIGWVLEYLGRGGFPRMENWSRYAAPGASGPEVAAFFRSQSPSIVTWQDLETFRRLWPGKLVLKGLQHPDDARRAVEAGVDGIIVSNHGGKAHDPLPAPLHSLPGIRAAVGEHVPVMIDSGIRRGSDIVFAACLGADFAFVGRPTLYGVAAGGTDGTLKAIDILKREIDLSLALIGCPVFDDLHAGFLFKPEAPKAPPEREAAPVPLKILTQSRNSV